MNKTYLLISPLSLKKVVNLGKQQTWVVQVSQLCNYMYKCKYVNVMDFQVCSLQIDEHFIHFWSLCRLQSQHSAWSLRKKCVDIHAFFHLLSSLLDLQSKVFHQINFTSQFTKKVHTIITSISDGFININ